MEKSSRRGQALLEILVFMWFCALLVLAVEKYESDVKLKQKAFRWEDRRD